MRAYVGGIYMSKVKLDGKVEHLIFLWVLLKFIQKFHQKMSKASKEIRNISWLQDVFKFCWKFHQIFMIFYLKLLKPSISALSHPFLITKRSIFYHLMFVSQTTAHFHYVSDKVDFHVATFKDQKYIKAKLNSAAATVWRERDSTEIKNALAMRRAMGWEENYWIFVTLIMKITRQNEFRVNS